MKKKINLCFVASTLSKSVWSLCLICGVAACSNDKEEANYPVTRFSKIELSEIHQGDAQTVSTTQTYAYHAGRLANFTAKQTYIAIEPVEMRTTTTIAYSDHQAIVADEFGTTSTYTLNEEGYAIRCLRNEGGGNSRSYVFSYQTLSDNKLYLKNMTETLEDGREYASIDIHYNGEGTFKINLLVDGFEQGYTAISSTENVQENKAEIPCLFLAEVYPLSMHSVALYGKLLGEPFKNLISQLIPDNNTPSNETITYTYKSDNRGIVTSCNATTNSYGKDYTRTVEYVIE